MKNIYKKKIQKLGAYNSKVLNSGKIDKKQREGDRLTSINE